MVAWHGRPDIASVALQCRGAPSIDAIETLVEELRSSGYREVITNALAPGPSLPLIDCGFEIRGRLHLLAFDFVEPAPISTRVTRAATSRRTRRSVSADRPEILRVDAAAFDDFWKLDEIGLDQATRATPRSHLRVTRGDQIAGYGLFGRAERTGYVQRLAIDPAAQGAGWGRALLDDGMRWLHTRGVHNVFVNTQVENVRALHLYEQAGFHRLPVGLCVLGRSL